MGSSISDNTSNVLENLFHPLVKCSGVILQESSGNGLEMSAAHAVQCSVLGNGGGGSPVKWQLE